MSNKNQSISSTTKEAAWDYATGIVQTEGIKPTPEFLELTEKEKRGEITSEDIRRILFSKYRMIEDTQHE